MKNLFKNFSKAAVLLVILIFAASCNKEKEKEPQPTSGNVMPSKMSINVPNSISSSTKGTGRLNSAHCAPSDTIKGCEIYELLRVFIEIGNNSGKIVDFLMTAISQNNINKAMTFQLTGDKDGRTKDYVVVENPVDSTNKTWEFKLEVKDSTNIALQVWWNRNPVEGLVILNLYHIDRVDNPDVINLMYQIEYSENKAITGYDGRMIVTLTGFPSDPVDKWFVNNFKMGVGINGSIVDVWGNSNHPNAVFIDTIKAPGRNYAFVAHGDTARDIGVAELAIVPSTVTTNDTILTGFALYDVLFEELETVWGPFTSTDSANVAGFLQEAKAPGYFMDTRGFVSAGNCPTPCDPGFTTSFIDLSGLTPFIPNDVANQTISWR